MKQIALTAMAAVALTELCNARRATPSPAATAATRRRAAMFPSSTTSCGNGLRVVLTEDHSVPVATIGVYYNIGFRIEPKDRTGFAHLFEHLMFQGSKNLAEGPVLQDWCRASAAS